MKLRKIIAKHKDIDRRIQTMTKHVQKLQDECRHKGPILKVPFSSGIMFDHHEIRLCTHCGLQEQGWNPENLHSGYGEHNRDVDVTLDELCKVRSEIIGHTHVGIG